MRNLKDIKVCRKGDTGIVFSGDWGLATVVEEFFEGTGNEKLYKSKGNDDKFVYELCLYDTDEVVEVLGEWKKAVEANEFCKTSECLIYGDTGPFELSLCLLESGRLEVSVQNSSREEWKRSESLQDVVEKLPEDAARYMMSLLEKKLRASAETAAGNPCHE